MIGSWLQLLWAYGLLVWISTYIILLGYEYDQALWYTHRVGQIIIHRLVKRCVQELAKVYYLLVCTRWHLLFAHTGAICYLYDAFYQLRWAITYVLTSSTYISELGHHDQHGLQHDILTRNIYKICHVK